MDAAKWKQKNTQLNVNYQFLHGGRMIKWKGKIVSCVPLSIALTFSLTLLSGFTIPAFANNEAGVPAGPADTINVPGSTYAGGITYGTNGLTLNFNDPTIVVTDGGVSVTNFSPGSANGVIINLTDVDTIINTAGRGVASIITNDFNTGNAITTVTTGDITSTSGEGIYAKTDGLGNAIVTMDGGSVTTNGVSAYGIHSRANRATSTSTATATLTDGTVITRSTIAHGLLAATRSIGGATATMAGGTLMTEGTGAYGLVSSLSRTTNPATASANFTGGNITTMGVNARGVNALTQGLGDTITTMTGGTLMTGAKDATGLYSYVINTASTATATATLTAGDITTLGQAARGLYALNGGLGNATTTMMGGSVITGGSFAYGLLSNITNAASAATSGATLTDGNIMTSGTSGIGVYALTSGLGDSIATMQGGGVATEGADASGLHSLISNTASTATANTTLNAGDITTTDTSAHGLYTETTGLGDAFATMAGGTVTTGGTSAYGLYADINNTTSTATASAIITAGSINTTGNTGHGVLIEQRGQGAVIATTGGVVTTTGVDAHGIDIQQINVAATGDATVMVNANITAGGDGVHIDTATSGETLVTGNANIIGGADVGDDGIEVNAVANVTIDINGVISGDPGIVVTTTLGAIDILGTGNVSGTADGIQANITGAGATTDITIARDGSVTGGLNGIIANNAGAGNNIIATTQAVNGGTGAAISSNTALGASTTFTIGANVTAGPGLIAIANNTGDSTTVVNAGSVIGQIRLGDGNDAMSFTAASNATAVTVFDGGDDVASGDTFVDTLTLIAQSISLAGANVVNWENLTLNGGSATFTDNALTVGSQAGTGLFLSNGALLNTIGGFALSGNLTNNGILNSQNGVAGDVISISGDYAGAGELRVDVDLATGQSDTLTIAGDVSSGGTQIRVRNISTGAPNGAPLTIVSVTGTTTAGDFVLAAPFINGAFSYTGFALDENGLDWVLQSVSETGAASFTPIASAIEGFGRS